MPELRERFVSAIVAGDFANALAVANDARPRGIPFLYEELIGPSLVEVGRRWQQGQLSVADEHIATAIAQSVIASFYPSFAWTPGGPKAIVACVANERHALGARMAADLLACDGWNIRFVGADVPLVALLELVVRERPIFVGLSAAMPERLSSVREAIAGLRRQVPATKLLVGGRAVTTEGAQVPELGADTIARSAASAVEAVRPWKR